MSRGRSTCARPLSNMNSATRVAVVTSVSRMSDWLGNSIPLARCGSKTGYTGGRVDAVRADDGTLIFSVQTQPQECSSCLRSMAVVQFSRIRGVVQKVLLDGTASPRAITAQARPSTHATTTPSLTPVDLHRPLRAPLLLVCT